MHREMKGKEKRRHKGIGIRRRVEVHERRQKRSIGVREQKKGGKLYMNKLEKRGKGNRKELA